MEDMRHVLGFVVVSCLVLAGCGLGDEYGITEDGIIPPPEDVAAPPADAIVTDSGLASKVLRVGMGHVRPTERSTVTVHFTGWTPDGQMFDSSVVRGTPGEWSMRNLIPGWMEGLQLMVVGEKRRFWVPGYLAYDHIDMPGAPKGPVVYDIELLNVR
jgi:FKBP-type peptidyl-prolyl cis-trans isomerase